MENSLHQRVLDKLAKLRSMTMERGASEAEALMAAQMMRKLMDEHNLTQTDLEIHESPMTDETFDRPYGYNSEGADYCCGGIEKYCGVKVFQSIRYEQIFGTNKVEKVRLIRMFGLKPDVEMAFYLYEIIAEAMERDSEAYVRKHQPTKKRLMQKSFTQGMAHRINARLVEMARALEPVAKTASGSALVVVKTAAVDEAFNKLGLKLKNQVSHVKTDANAWWGGHAAGNNVNLNRPVGQNSVNGYLG